VEWIRFLLFLFLDRINQSSLKLRPGMQDYQKFFSPAARGLSAEGRIILRILRAGA
jgi:hypothetical protein